MIINISNNFPIPTTNKRPFPALPVGRDIEPRVVEFFCFFWVVGGEIFCQEAAACLGDCLLCVLVAFNCIYNYGSVWHWIQGKGMVSQVRVWCQRTSREASAYVTNNSLSMRTASAACFSSRRCERVRASFSKAVCGSVMLFGPARLYDAVRGFWARALNLPFWGVSFIDL